MREQRNRAGAGRWVRLSPVVILLSVGCGDLGADPVSNGLATSYGGSAGSFAGSGGSGGTGSVVCPSTVVPGAVKAILGENCSGCHGAQLLAGAPMPLETWNDLQQPASKQPFEKSLRARFGSDDRCPGPHAPAGSAFFCRHQHDPQLG